MFHMDNPVHPRALTMRRAYFYPFWRIEASAKRWEWQVASADFVPSCIDPDLASTFLGYIPAAGQILRPVVGGTSLDFAVEGALAPLCLIQTFQARRSSSPFPPASVALPLCKISSDCDGSEGAILT